MDEEEQKTAWFIFLEREHVPSMIIGPYDDEDDAVNKMENSLFIDGLCEEDCLNCSVVLLPVMDINPLILAIEYVIPPEEVEVGVFHHGAQEIMQ